MKSIYAKGVAITACGVLVISPDGLLTRLIQTDHWTMIFWRALLLSFGMWLIICITQSGRILRQYRSVRGRGLMMVLAYTLGTVTFIYAITHTSVANTLVILSTTPLFAALIGWFALNEPIKTRTWAAIIMVILGVAVISSGSVSQGSHWVGDIAAIFGAFFLACGFSLVRRLPQVSAFAAISCSGLLTAVLVLPFAAPFSVSETDIIYLTIMGVFIVPIGTGLMFVGPRYIPAAEVGLLLLLETVLGPLWVWLVLAEAPGERTLLGGAIVVSTLAMNAVWALKKT